jgi:type 1 glutamine amidotransferase
MHSNQEALVGAPGGWTPPRKPKTQRLLYFTRTVGYEHAAVARGDGEISFSERALMEMGARAGFEVECTKDGSVFDDDFDHYDCLVFYTLGDLLREDERCTPPPMSPRGKKRLLGAIASGKAFVGFHAATDTFRLFEEWYVFKKVSREMHVILALDTGGMKGNVYDRPPVPGTWARTYGRGRVFYTSLGHREDVWQNPIFQQIAYAGLAWAMGNVDADVTPNFDEATPKGDQYRWVPVEPGCVSR